MPRCKIYKPAKTAMQSGQRNTKKWVLEFESTKSHVDILMGWIGSSNTSNQVRIYFNTKEEAVLFAKQNKLKAEIYEPKKRDIQKRNYSDNFSERFRFQ